jgi:hypothetical protein
VETTLVSCPPHTDWKVLYKAAILETQKKAIARRVSEAEAAVLARGREVFYNGGSAEEKEALELALYILRAFKAACDCTTRQTRNSVG